MTSLFLLVGSGALLALGCAAWWRLRRRPASTRSFAPPDVASPSIRGATASGADVPAAMPAAIDGTRGRDLLHRLVALAFADTLPDDEAIEPTGYAALVADADALLARIDAQPKYMPRRPQLLPQLMRAANDPDASLASIARIIAQDPTLSANLLRVANSAFHRISIQPVESIERAVAVLGLDGLRPVMATALVQPVMGAGDGALGRLPTVIWEHTLASADAAVDYARHVERDDAFAAQLLALLHGLGAIIVVQVLRDVHARHPVLAPDPRVVARLLEAWSAATARRVAHGWGLSERMSDALVAQQSDALPSTPLGRALRVGRTAGALALLCRMGQLDEGEGIALLSALDVGDAAGWDAGALWARQRA